MSWSTRQLAELAGTTLRAIRHYHEVGLLDEPERQANGYKRYGVEHLVRVIRIKRLSNLGFTLTQIAGIDETDAYPEQALQGLNAEVTDDIKRLEQMRTELAQVLQEPAPIDLPPGVAQAAANAGLTETDHSMLVVWSRVLGPNALETSTELLRSYEADPAEAAWDALPADADEQTRQDVAERMLPRFRDMMAAHPGLQAPDAATPGHSKQAILRELTTAIIDLYNPAQIDVLRRIGRALTADPEPDRHP
ncbi:MerR family transcriptional regulator [Nocardiopsis mangrovi]|uniref:MerR family transcriptional regulator n=1 Tax=Nocardiopsis mangrovi TaxID=1179818 RepID=A0ABV9DWD4_9ACTN